MRCQPLIGSEHSLVGFQDHRTYAITINISLFISTMRVFRQKCTLEDAIGSHSCSLEANTRVTNGIPLGCSLLLPVDTVNRVQTLKVVDSSLDIFSGTVVYFVSRYMRKRDRYLYPMGKGRFDALATIVIVRCCLCLCRRFCPIP
jgi:hypothetical protein